MKVSKHKFLAFSFALVLVGILIIQGYWIFSVIKTKNKQFDDSVYNALQGTIKKLEEKENVTFISRFGSNTLKQSGSPMLTTQRIEMISGTKK